MNRLFGGLFFVLLDFELTVGTAVFDVLPDFIGFYLMMKGMEQLAEKSEKFDKGRHVVFGLTIISVIIYGAKLMNPDAMTQVWLWAAELAVLIVVLVVVRMAVLAVREIGLEAEQLAGMWLILAVMLPLCHVLGWVPLVGSICSVARTVTAALFLLALYGTMKNMKKSAD